MGCISETRYYVHFKQIQECKSFACYMWKTYLTAFIHVLLKTRIYFKHIRPSFFYFLFYRFFLQQVSVGGRNKN